MFGTHYFDADMDECYKQCQTNCIEACEMLLSNKNIDTFLAKFWLLRVKTVKIMCHCSEYPLKSAVLLRSEPDQNSYFLGYFFSDQKSRWFRCKSK